MADESSPKNAITIFGALDKPRLGSSAEPLTIDLTALETRIEPAQSETMGPAAGPAADATSPGSNRYSPLFASIVAALLFGAIGGAAATYGLSREAPAAANPAAPLSDETNALREQVERLSSQLAALKSGLETASRASTQQLTRIGERLDRAEKAQTEPAAKLAKLSESVDRLERRTASAPAPDVTGSVTSIEKQQSKPPSLDGWKLRDYYAGRAVLESRDGTLFDVMPGATLPGVGKIETIKRVDGKVVVTTPKGTITSSLESPRRLPYHLPPGY